MGESNGDAPVKLGWGAYLQIALLIGTIGIAWGNLSAKQATMERVLDAQTKSIEQMHAQVVDLKLEFMRMSTMLNRHKGWSGDEESGK